ncbi:MAG TPA: SRPBCC domain-containing protein [Saprospiraceae bacterium]|nr:SRPBCC domain-containing protein [Saprospiraceae bacterium]
MGQTIRHEFSYNHPPEVIWIYLTDPDLLAQWLMPSDFKAEVGHHFMFKTKPMKKLGFDGLIYCQVLEVIPNEKLVYSWKGGMSKENPSLDSMVVWTLSPTPNGSKLLLEHRGFKGIKNYLSYFIMNMGWKKIGDRIAILIKKLTS